MSLLVPAHVPAFDRGPATFPGAGTQDLHRIAALGGTVAIALALMAAGCSEGDDPDAGIGAELFELADASVYAGAPGIQRSRAFDVVAADMDADGDSDLLVNWHHKVPLELYRNDGDRLVRVNVPGDDRSGLDDVPGIASLFADSDEMRARIRTSGRPGLHVWHDETRRASWHLYWKGDERSDARFSLELITALSIKKMEGLEPGELQAPDERTRRITVARGPGDFEFTVVTEQLTSSLELELRSSDGEALSIWAGREPREFATGEALLWKPDPHGMAWGDIEGSPMPELYVARGGLKGLLVPPRHPKRDRYFLGGTAGGPWFIPAPEGTVPADWGRGRAVELVDVDNDGQLEVSVSNEETPNKLLKRDGDGGAFHDVAAEYGLDLEGAEVQSWCDHDGDGWQDLYYLNGHAVDVLRNRGGGRFERLAGASIGLTLPESDPASIRQFNFASLRHVDFDCDGDLDLWVLMFGQELTNHVFLREGDRFSRASERLGLGAIRDNIFAVLADLDGDGFEDAVSNGALHGETQNAVLWHNRGGKRFDISPLTAVPKPVHIGTNLDIDRDGRWDIACMSTDRYLLRNTGTSTAFVDVALGAKGGTPVGAVVKAHYDDGRVIARRYGSAYNSASSQALRPLRFAVPAGRRIEQLTVRWPGERNEQTYPAPPTGQLLRLDRP